MYGICYNHEEFGIGEGYTVNAYGTKLEAVKQHAIDEAVCQGISEENVQVVKEHSCEGIWLIQVKYDLEGDWSLWGVIEENPDVPKPITVIDVPSNQYLIIAQELDAYDSIIVEGTDHNNALCNSLGKWDKQEGCIDFNDIVGEPLNSWIENEDYTVVDDTLTVYGDGELFVYVRKI